jgi:hypothetical protein
MTLLIDVYQKQLPIIHGGLVCYDTSDRNSLDCIPDLLSKCGPLLDIFFFFHFGYTPMLY